MAKIFISHASEDKDELARPLADQLSKVFDVWFDERELHLGDSLLGQIQVGLSQCDYGVVILSPSFFRKKWPQAELDGLFALEIANGKRILPVWKDLDFDAVLKHSPILAGRLAIDSSTGIISVAKAIERAVIHELDRGVVKPEYQISISEMCTTLDILDDSGRTVIFKDSFLITALVDGVSRYTEQFQSDGVIEDFKVSIGSILNARKEESIIYLDSDLGVSLNAGESIRRTISCMYKDSFTESEEYWVIRQSNPNSSLNLNIYFPKNRPPTSVKGVMRKLNYDELVTRNPPLIKFDPERGSYISWVIGKLGSQTSYKVAWRW